VVFTQGALIALTVCLVGGLLSAVYHWPRGGAALEALGLDLRSLRPLHTVFGAAWLLLASIAVVARYLQDHAPTYDAPERWRLRGIVLAWALAGTGILVSLPAGWTSGREYMGYHPIWSIPIALGWALLTWTVLRETWRGFWARPVYVAMWGTGCVLFAATFLEQHAWLLPGVFADPIVDRRIQWKACGTLVGALNLMVYGAIHYVGERLGGDPGFARRKRAWALFYLALANTFLNYLHHTYHLPQGHGLKWFGFAISMTEIGILWATLRDLTRAKGPHGDAGTLLLHVAKVWALFVLVTAIPMSVPPLNTLIHGTWTVAGHAMAGMVGLDTMAMLGALAWLLSERDERAAALLASAAMRRRVVVLNLAIAVLVLWLHGAGAWDGVTRYLAPTTAEAFSWRSGAFSTALPAVLLVSGVVAFFSFVSLLWSWFGLAFAARRARALVSPEARRLSPGSDARPAS